MFDIAIVIGHDLAHPGATSATGVSEHQWNSQLAQMIAHECFQNGLVARCFGRNASIVGYRAQMTELAGRLNETRPRAIIELHFNAALPDFRGQWHGTSVLHYPGSRGDRALAKALSREVSAAQSTSERSSNGIRGARATKVDGGGTTLHLLALTSAPCVLLESHFGDNAKEHARATQARDSGETARAIVRAYQSAF